MQRTTRVWKNLYKTLEDVLEEIHKEEAAAKPEERRKRKEEKIEEEKKVEEEENKKEREEERKDEDKGTDEQQSVQGTHLSPPSSPHSPTTPEKIIKIKDVVDTTCQNINPLTATDLTKILDQTTLQTQLCTNPILVSVDNLQKSVDKLKEVNVPSQQPPLYFEFLPSPLLLACLLLVVSLLLEVYSLFEPLSL